MVASDGQFFLSDFVSESYIRLNTGNTDELIASTEADHWNYLVSYLRKDMNIISVFIANNSPFVHIDQEGNIITCSISSFWDTYLFASFMELTSGFPGP